MMNFDRNENIGKAGDDNEYIEIAPRTWVLKIKEDNPKEEPKECNTPTPVTSNKYRKDNKRKLELRKEGRVVKEYESLNKASKALGVSIASIYKYSDKYHSNPDKDGYTWDLK